MTGRVLSRRRFLSISACTILTGAMPRICSAFLCLDKSSERLLSFYNTHTEESLVVEYMRDGAYVSGALNDINTIMRDHRTGDIRPISPRLLDVLFGLSRSLETRHPFHIISGYRSPSTNRLLRKKDDDVAKRSFHTLGKAADVFLPDCSLCQLQKAALRLRAGGVGYYPRSNFIHIDVGPIRCW
jgi:uncharacterized protein YcbK (DUF882 family)